MKNRFILGLSYMMAPESLFQWSLLIVLVLLLPGRVICGSLVEDPLVDDVDPNFFVVVEYIVVEVVSPEDLVGEVGGADLDGVASLLGHAL